MTFWDNGVFSFIVSAISSSIICIMIVITIKNKSKYINKSNKAKETTIMALVSLAIFQLFAIHTTIDALYAILSTITDSFYPTWCISQFLQMFVYAVGKLTFYLFLVLRLHQVFTGTAIAITVWKLKLLALLFIIPMFLFATIQVNISSHALPVFLSYNQNWSDINKFSDCTRQYSLNRSKTQNMLKMIGITFYLLMDIICPIIVLRLFLSRIIKVSVGIGVENIQNKQKDTQLIHLAIKTTNLCILAISFNWIALIKFGWKLPIAILHIDVIVNCLSVYLSYEFADNHYNILFKPCHHLCYNTCIICCYCCCSPTTLLSGLKLATGKSQPTTDLSYPTTNITGTVCSSDSEAQSSNNVTMEIH